MSIVHYIGANKPLQVCDESKIILKKIVFKSMELPGGTIPLDQIIDLPKFKSDEIVEYDSLIDAAGIYVVKSCNKEVRRHIKGKYLYSVSPDFGRFILNEQLRSDYKEQYYVNEKCIIELLKYIEVPLNKNEIIEIYTCWEGEEGQERDYSLDRIIDLQEFKLVNFFELKIGQYIIFTKSDVVD